MTNEKPTMFVVLAHPDDESFGPGGTLALYSQKGVSINLVCLTGGEAGTVEQEFLQGYDSISDLRADELDCAAKELGLENVIAGWHRDSGMSGTPDNEHPDALMNQPIEEIASQLAHKIREMRPQVILTHDPIGGNLHPDHIASYNATARAFILAADPKFQESDLPAYQAQKLYGHTIPKKWLKVAIWLLKLFRRDPHRLGRNQDYDLISIVEAGDFPIHTRINIRQVIKIRDAAIACHASQLAGGPQNSGLISQMLRWVAGVDLFTRLYPEISDQLLEHDLFEGVSLSSAPLS